MKNIIILTGLLLSSLSINAQSDVSAWLFSSTEFGGTSRYNAMGGAFAALGGDVSVMSHNPAGIGLFRRSELSITPSFQMNSLNSRYLSISAEDIKGNFNLNNLAYVSSKKLDDNDWRNVQIGISYNRLRDFHTRTSNSGTTTGLTFADQLASYGDGFSSDNFSEIDAIFLYPAWQTYVIDPGVEDETYVSAFTGNSVKQVYNKETIGRIGETNITFGGNYKDRLYVGGGIGIQRVKMEYESSFSETADYEISGVGLSSYRILETGNTSGSGINLNLGMIARINDNVRLGLAYHSPSFMSLTSDIGTVFNSAYSDGLIREESSEVMISDYDLNTPSRLVAGIALVFGKHGVIDVDYEYVNYQKMKLSPAEFSFADYSDDNDDIQENFTSVGNLRAGAEWRLQPISLRVGTAFYQNPNADGTSLNTGDRLIYTAGVGYKRNGMYLDMAYVLRTYDNETYLYGSGFSELVTNSYQGNSLSMTFGVRF